MVASRRCRFPTGPSAGPMSPPHPPRGRQRAICPPVRWTGSGSRGRNRRRAESVRCARLAKCLSPLRLSRVGPPPLGPGRPGLAAAWGGLTPEPGPRPGRGGAGESSGAGLGRRTGQRLVLGRARPCRRGRYGRGVYSDPGQDHPNGPPGSQMFWWSAGRDPVRRQRQRWLATPRRAGDALR